MQLSGPHVHKDNVEDYGYDRSERENARTLCTHNCKRKKKRCQENNRARKGPPYDNARPIASVGIATVSQEFHNADNKERRSGEQIHSTQNAAPSRLGFRVVAVKEASPCKSK